MIQQSTKTFEANIIRTEYQRRHLAQFSEPICCAIVLPESILSGKKRKAKSPTKSNGIPHIWQFGVRYIPSSHRVNKNF